MRINREIRAVKVRLITEDGDQIGIFNTYDALAKAKESCLDLVEISPGANPPVCKIMDYGKFRYQQTKRERISKKVTHQTKIKELKFKPNIDAHDLEIKIKHAREFIEKGCKVKFTCSFRGREIVFIDNSKVIMEKICMALEDIATVETPAKVFGKSLSLLLTPSLKEKKHQQERKNAESEN